LALIERDVLIRGELAFTICTDGADEERFNDGYIILLTDLLLICRIKSQEEIDDLPEGDESMFWLLFPPLAIRHVTARDCSVDEDGKSPCLGNSSWFMDNDASTDWTNTKELTDYQSSS